MVQFIRVVAMIVIIKGVAYEFMIIYVIAVIMVVAIEIIIEVTNRSVGNRILGVAVEVITFLVKW